MCNENDPLILTRGAVVQFILHCGTRTPIGYYLPYIYCPFTIRTVSPIDGISCLDFCLEMTVKPELPTYTSDNIGNNALPTRNSIYFEPGTKYLCSMIVMYNYLILCTYTLALMRAKINQCHFGKSRLFVTGRPKYGPTFGAGQKNNQCPGTLDLLDGLDEPMRYLY